MQNSYCDHRNHLIFDNVNWAYDFSCTISDHFKHRSSCRSLNTAGTLGETSRCLPYMDLGIEQGEILILGCSKRNMIFINYAEVKFSGNF